MQGNLIGLNAAASGKIQNLEGIPIFAGAQSNTIGGTDSAARNVISGNQFSGISIIGDNAKTISFRETTLVSMRPVRDRGSGTAATISEFLEMDQRHPLPPHPAEHRRTIEYRGRPNEWRAQHHFR